MDNVTTIKFGIQGKMNNHGGKREGAGRKSTDRKLYGYRLTEGEREAVNAALADYRNSAEVLFAKFERQGWHVYLLDGVDLGINDVAGLLKPNKAIIQVLTENKAKLVAYLQDLEDDAE